MLKLEGITKIYNSGEIGEVSLFEDFSLTMEDGEFLSIVGSNGSGKTSMLNMICGTIPIEKGDISIDGKSILSLPEHKRYETIGRVYQNPSFGTSPNLTMLENMSLADNKGKSFGLQFGVQRKREQFYKEQLSILGLGLEDKMTIKLGALSGGQRQAVALVMATLTPIKFLILDEHTAALDPKTADTIMELTGKVIREKKLTALMVTHNLRYAVDYGNRLLMMDKGNAVFDAKGAEKEKLRIDDILGLFTSISIECGN
ncbi:MAG: ATP-binding cassette domain-containing protein [Bacillota bacterium]